MGARVGPGDLPKADLMAGVQFALQNLGVASGRGAEEAIDAPEIAVDAFRPLNLLDAVDGRRLARVIAARLLEPAQADVLVIKIVELGGEMGAGAGRHAAAEGAAIETDDGLAGLAQLVSGGQAGDARADHDDVGPVVLRERRSVAHLRRAHPQGDTAFRAYVHRRTLTF